MIEKPRQTATVQRQIATTTSRRKWRNASQARAPRLAPHTGPLSVTPVLYRQALCRLVCWLCAGWCADPARRASAPARLAPGGSQIARGGRGKRVLWSPLVELTPD